MSYAASQESSPAILPFAHPLDEFYAREGMQLPRIDRLAASAVPPPYNELLVHEGDMTPTLEKFHGSNIHLRVLRREQHGDFYFRQVLLLTDDGEKPVEFGAIKIFLEQFPTAARNEILSERIPLGTILARNKIAHLSRPKAYVRINSDGYINKAFSIEGVHTLFGRRNTLSTPEHHILAEIFEILPPGRN
jgi:chorismate-pyruvate lyase